MNFMIAVLVAMSVVTTIGAVANVGLILMAEEKRDLILPAIFSVLLVLLGSGTGAIGHKTVNNIESRTNVKSCECITDSADPVNLQVEGVVD